MELGTKVTALEEEIAVLKGEIKTILQEVRTAVLARENPFAADAPEGLFIPPTPVAVPTEPPAIATPSEPETPASEPQIPHVIQLPRSEPGPQTAATYTSFSGRDETDVARPAPRRRRWNLSSLAALIAWTRETASRMDPSDLDVVLSLARYGGLIDEELEATLTRLAAPLAQQTEEPRQKGVTDYLLALRELAALTEEAEESNQGSGPLRRAS